MFGGGEGVRRVWCGVIGLKCAHVIQRPGKSLSFYLPSLPSFFPPPPSLPPSQGFKSADHPFGILVNNIIKCFIQSYGGVGAHGNLLPHATGELSSVMTRVHRLVR